MKVLRQAKENKKLVFLIVSTAVFMLLAVIWVYHIKVLNAPKVYSDGFGYFVYLPAIIHNDFTFSFVEGWEHPLSLNLVDGGLLNKYPVGVAIMESPFFFAAHLVSLLRDAITGSFTATGYSNLYQYAILFGGIFYWIIGTIILYALLTRYLHFSKNVSVIACALITYATNLFHYASYDACFSHIYSYALFNIFLYYLCWYEEREIHNHEKNKLYQTCIFGLLAGLIFMVRNTNIIFVVTYIFYGVRDWSTFKQRIRKIIAPKRAIPIVITGFITLLPQLCYWHAITGKWFVYSYGSNEPFYWGKPQIGNFLFSVRKGLLFWCPILLLAIIGMIYAYKRRQQLYTGLIIFIVLILYISSAWWCWYYGGSFGQRVAVDFIGVFAIFIAYLYSYIEKQMVRGDKSLKFKMIQVGTYAYSGICLVWNLVCMFAYWYRILPSDKATWATVGNILEWVGSLFP